MKHLQNKTPVITAALFALCLPVTLCAVQAGTLDTTFNPSGTPPGTVTTNPTSSTSNIARAVISQPDGKIIAAGSTNTPQVVLARYAVDGALDTSFGTGGIVIASIGSATAVQVYDATLQPDGKILVTGYAASGTTKIFVARYNTDGTPDNSFGTGGIQLTPIGSFATGDGIAVQPDGKIVVAATILNTFTVVRYNSNGTLDNSFGTGGITTTPINGGDVNAMVLQSDGKIVVAGSASVAGVRQFTLARYNTDGFIDTSFGTGGITFTPISGGDSIAYAIALQSDGKIVLGGESQGLSFLFTLARYTTGGLLDTTFGTSGVVITNTSRFLRGIAIQPDDKIIAAGYSVNSSTNFTLARYRPNGILDATFGAGGIVTTSIYNHPSGANAITLAPDGKIVLAGAAFGATILFAVARYNGDPTSLRCSLALINKYGPRL